MADRTADAPTADDATPKPLAPVLWISIVAMLVTPFLAPSMIGRITSTLLVGGSAVVALRVSGARRSVIVAGEVIVVCLTLTSLLSREIGDAENFLTTVGVALLSLLLLVTPAVVVRRLATRPRITLDTVAGALAAYIQIGLFFSTTFRLVELVGSAPFFTEISNPSTMDFQFFSFVTLTTLGYGDLVPGTEVGQSLSMVEAVLGQVFLVTVVAMAVGNLGATLPHRRQS